MVFARTSKCAARLAKQVRERSFGKEYLAVTRGTPPAEGTLVHDLHKDRAANRVEIVAGPGTIGEERRGKTGRRSGGARSAGGRGETGDRAVKRAELGYRRLEVRGGCALVRVVPITGRSHQIRVQLAAIGFPLLGDRKYGPDPPGADTVALWSSAIELDHPTRGERMRFESSPPRRPPWDRFRSQSTSSPGFRST